MVRSGKGRPKKKHRAFRRNKIYWVIQLIPDDVNQMTGMVTLVMLIVPTVTGMSLYYILHFR